MSSSESESSQDEGDGAEEEDNTKETRVGLRPQVMGRRHLIVKNSRSTLIPRTPSLALVSLSMNMRTQTQNKTPERKSHQHGKSSTRTAPKRTAPRKTPVNHHLPRRSHQLARHSVMGPGKKHSCWTPTLMPGIMPKLPMMLWAGQQGTP